MDIYVGRQREDLVLKCPAGLDNEYICRFYPLGKDHNETIIDAGRWLNLEFNLEGIAKPRFLKLKDPVHEIFPFDFDAIKLLKKGYKEGFPNSKPTKSLTK